MQIRDNIMIKEAITNFQSFLHYDYNSLNELQDARSLFIICYKFILLS